MEMLFFSEFDACIIKIVLGTIIALLLVVLGVFYWCIWRDFWESWQDLWS